LTEEPQSIALKLKFHLIALFNSAYKKITGGLAKPLHSHPVEVSCCSQAAADSVLPLLCVHDSEWIDVEKEMMTRKKCHNIVQKKIEKAYYIVRYLVSITYSFGDSKLNNRQSYSEGLERVISGYIQLLQQKLAHSPDKKCSRDAPSHRRAVFSKVRGCWMHRFVCMQRYDSLLLADTRGAHLVWSQV